MLRSLKNISKRKQMKFWHHLKRGVGSSNSNFQIIPMNSLGCILDQKAGGISKKQNGHSQTKYKKFGRSLREPLLKQKKMVQWHLMTSVLQPNAIPKQQLLPRTNSLQKFSDQKLKQHLLSRKLNSMHWLMLYKLL